MMIFLFVICNDSLNRILHWMLADLYKKKYMYNSIEWFYIKKQWKFILYKKIK